LLKKTHTKDENQEEPTELELDTNEQMKLGISKALIWCIIAVVVSLIIIVVIILYMRHKKNVKQ
jgi:cell division septal protein FtsQ